MLKRWLAMIDRPLETLSEALIMENWLNIFLLILFGALANLIVAFIVLRALAGVFGVPEEKNNSRRALLALLTIVPVAGVAGAPFFLIPFAGPFFGIALSFRRKIRAAARPGSEDHPPHRPGDLCPVGRDPLLRHPDDMIEWWGRRER
jgi:hypothetical protein